MIYTELTKKALKLSFEAHKDQVDKSGMPYVYHKSVREKEREISIQAGRIVGELYKALLKRFENVANVKMLPKLNANTQLGNGNIGTGNNFTISHSSTLAALNRLCVRLVFIFYAEDAEVFPKDAFWNLLKETPAKFLRERLKTLFEVLDTPLDKRDPYLEPELAIFPYTNGGLFKCCQCENVAKANSNSQFETGNIGTGNTSTMATFSLDDIPPLDDEIKELLVKSSNFDWRDISPTIFGALFESTLNPVTRRAGGMVYTSVENIHKVIDPLFLDDLTKQVDEATKGTEATEATEGTSDKGTAASLKSFSSLKSLSSLEGGSHG